MLFRAVGNRVAVCLEDLELPMDRKEVLERLIGLGFETTTIDVVALARAQIGRAAYRRSARLAEAPGTFDCSSLMKWVYGQRGIWLPRRTIQQRVQGSRVARNEIQAGDLVFTTGRINYWYDDPADGVGHLGIATGEDTVVHAANRRVGLIETAIGEFAPQEKFRGACRIVPFDREVLTLICPEDREVETSDDIRWIVLQTLRIA